MQTTGLFLCRVKPGASQQDFLSDSQAASSRPSPVEIWQILLSRLLDQHYGLTLNDTPFADERVIEQHIEAGISLCDAVNFLVEKYALVLPTSRDSAPVPALS